MSSTGSMSALGTPRVNGIASAMSPAYRGPAASAATHLAPRVQRGGGGCGADADHAARIHDQADHAGAHVAGADRDRECVTRLRVVAGAQRECVVPGRQPPDEDRGDAGADVPV